MAERPEGPYPTCNFCGAEVVAFLSKTAKNPNRWFFKCPHQVGAEQHFWQWVDEWRAAGGAAGGGGNAGQQQHQQPTFQHAPVTPGARHGGAAGPSHGPAPGAYGGGGAGSSQPPPPHSQYGGGPPQYGSPQRQGATGAYGGPTTPQQPQPLRQPQWQSPRTSPPPAATQWPQHPQGPHQGQPQQQQQQQHGYANPYSAQPPPPAAGAAAPGGGVGHGTPVYVQILQAGGGGDIGFSTPVFDEAFRGVFMQLPYNETGRHWDAQVRAWRVRVEAYPQAKQLLEDNGYRVEDAPPRVISALVRRNGPHNAKISAEEAGEFVGRRVDPALWARLFPYQREGVLAGVRFGGRLLLADEMGLGKTVQALTLLSCYPEDWPLLIICPTTLRFSWAAAVQEWLPRPLRPGPSDLWLVSASADWDKMAARGWADDWRLGADADADADAGAGAGAAVGAGGGRRHIAIVSYDLAAKMSEEHRRRYRSVICDESHMLKSRTTQRYRAVAPLVRGARRAVLCTGTPLLNRPIEVWPQVDMLRPGLLGSFTEFGDRYCLSTQAYRYREQQRGGGGGRGGSPYGRGGGGGGFGGGGPWPGSEYTGCTLSCELHALLAECVMVRRLKSAVLRDLPPKIRTKVPLQPSPADLRQVAAELRRLRDVQAAQAKGQLSEVEAHMARQQAWSAAYRATGPAKLPEALAFIDRLLHVGTDDDELHGGGGGGGAADGDDGGGDGGVVCGPAKVLVFAHHQEVLNQLGAHLKQRRVRTVRIDGSTPPPQRERAVSEFQATGDRTPRVALLSLHAAGAGLTLTAASVVVFVELDQTPSLLAQAEDRAHRVGQDSHVHVYYLMGRGTLDEQIWAMLERKKFVMGATLDGEARQAQADWGGDDDGGGDAGGGGGGGGGGGRPLHDYDLPMPQDFFSGGGGGGEGSGDDDGGAGEHTGAGAAAAAAGPSTAAASGGGGSGGGWGSHPRLSARSPPHTAQATHGGGAYGGNAHVAAVLADQDPEPDPVGEEGDAHMAHQAAGGSQHSTSNRGGGGSEGGGGGGGSLPYGVDGGSVGGAGGALFGRQMELPPLPAASMAARAALARASGSVPGGAQGTASGTGVGAGPDAAASASPRKRPAASPPQQPPSLRSSAPGSMASSGGGSRDGGGGGGGAGYGSGAANAGGGPQLSGSRDRPACGSGLGCGSGSVLLDLTQSDGEGEQDGGGRSGRSAAKRPRKGGGGSSGGDGGGGNGSGVGRRVGAAAAAPPVIEID